MSQQFTKAEQEVLVLHFWVVDTNYATVNTNHGPFAYPWPDELNQAGHLALAESLCRYDRSRTSFAQYAMSRVLGAMLDQLRAETRQARIAIAAHKAAAVFCGRLQDDFKVMLHDEGDARVQLDGGLDGMLTAYLVATTEAATHDAVRDPLAAHDDYAYAMDALREALGTLSDEDRKLLLLTLYDRCTQEEAGAALDMAVSTVYRRIQQALVTLRFELERRDVTYVPEPVDMHSHAE